VKVWRCGYCPDEEDGFRETWDCLRRQRDQLEAANAELRGDLERVAKAWDRRKAVGLGVFKFGATKAFEIGRILAQYRKGK
jgi:hypothetical protein